MRESLTGFEGGVRFGGKEFTNFRYADDSTLIMQKLTRFHEPSCKPSQREKGLLLNYKKTKDNGYFLLDGQGIEQVSES